MLDIMRIKHLIYPDYQNSKEVIVVRRLIPPIHNLDDFADSFICVGSSAYS